jgi:hypothetical protein
LAPPELDIILLVCAPPNHNNMAKLLLTIGAATFLCNGSDSTSSSVVVVDAFAPPPTTSLPSHRHDIGSSEGGPGVAAGGGFTVTSTTLSHDGHRSFKPLHHPRYSIGHHQRSRQHSRTELAQHSPIRKSGSLFGLFNFTSSGVPSLQFGDASQDDDNDDEVVEEGDPLDAMTSNYDEDDTSLDAIDNASSSSASKAHQLANKTKSKLLCKPSDNEVSIVATSDDTDKITIIHKSKHPQGEQQSGDNSIGERKEGKQSKSLEMDWDATLMELQKNELTGFTSTSPSSDDNDLNATKASGGLEDEEDFDELAGMLMGQTTLLSSSNGRKWGDSFADRRAMIKAGAAASQQLQQEEIQKERDGLSSERNDEEMSVEAPTLEEEESDDLDELTLGYLEVEKSRIEDMLGDSLNEEDAENASEIQSKEKDSAVVASDDASESIDVNEGAIVSSSRSLSPTHSIESDYKKMKESDVDEESIEAELVATEDEGVDSTIVAKGDATDTSITIPKNEKPTSPDKEPTSTADTLESFLERATSFIPPLPLVTPTNRDTHLNVNSTMTNISEINQQLQTTLENQRGDLGKLRRRIHELERDLIRANRNKAMKLDDEVNERMEPLRNECDRQVVQANETIAILKEHVFVSHWHFAMLFVNHPLFWLCLIDAFHTRCSPFQALLWSVGSPLLSTVPSLIP